MTRSLYLLTSATMALLMLSTSETVHPFYYAFSPLKDAFSGQFPQLKPVGDAEIVLPTIQPPSRSTSSPDVDLNEAVDVNKESHIGLQKTTISTTIPKITTASGTTTAPINSQVTSGSTETQTTLFNLQTFTFNRNNTKRVNDIFSILSGIEDSRPLNSGDVDEQVKDNTIPNYSFVSNLVNGLGQNTAVDISKSILLAFKNIENVLTTMKFMKGLYQAKSENVKPIPTNSSSSSFSPSSSSSSSLNGTTASVIDALLDVPTLEGIQTAALTAKSEGEFLDHLASVLLGAETRSTALTLDPVTVIALLTLAAYLIRAVYQILTVTGRSLDVFDGNFNLALSDLPETMVRIHNWISASNFDFARDARFTRDVREEITIPGDVAAVFKLHREGHNACVRQFLCQQLQYRPLKSLTLSDIIIGGVSYYYGETATSRYIDSLLLSNREDQTSCRNDPPPHPCSTKALNDANSLKGIFYNAAGKIVDLMATYSNWL